MPKINRRNAYNQFKIKMANFLNVLDWPKCFANILPKKPKRNFWPIQYKALNKSIRKR